MKKVIALILIVIVIVICASLLLLRKGSFTSNVSTSGDEEQIVEIASSGEDTDVSNIDLLDNSTVIEIKGKKLKNINVIPKNEIKFNDGLEYIAPIKDGEELYVKLSNDFFLNETKEVRTGELESEKSAEQIEMIPIMIYTPDVDDYYVYSYNDDVYYIPTIKCEAGEERIVYRDYGLEIVAKDNSIKINDSSVKDVIWGWDLRDLDFSLLFDYDFRDDEVSLCEAYLTAWRITEKKNDFFEERYSDYRDYWNTILEPQWGTKLFQVDFDDDPESLQFIFVCGIMDHVHIDSEVPSYKLVYYSKEYGAKCCEEEMLLYNNVLNYKNVFYGYEAFEYGPKIDRVILIDEDIITGYYIFDKEKGLVHVDRFANGLKFGEEGFKELSKITLTLSEPHTIKIDEDGNYYIDAFPMYDRVYMLDENGDLIHDEETGYKVDDSYEIIKEGTKIYITEIGEDGYWFRFKTEDGREFKINYYYV